MQITQDQMPTYEKALIIISCFEVLLIIAVILIVGTTRGKR